MLSKSQARVFFIVGTLLFSGVFGFLTYDTLQKVPKQTNAADLTQEVKAGKLIWEENNCMGCHTLLGEGSYYAPELTKVYERRGPTWIRVFIKDPQAMFPGERKMVKYDFTDKQISQLIAFFKWIGRIDTNGFPPEPNIQTTAVVVTQKTTDATEPPQIFSQMCTACHMVQNKGGRVGPALDAVGNKFSKEYLEKWISNPQEVKPGTNMPRLPLTDEQKKELVSYLSKLK